MHDHDHPHSPPQPDDPEPSTEHHFLGLALRELLIEKGHITADDERRMIERIESQTPAIGAAVVARAWVDPAYRARLLAHGRDAIAELGFNPGNYPDIIVLENTARLHNVVVCTLCSCYPRPLLGRPPAWYKSAAYRARVVREPRAVLAEFGTHLAADVEVRVHDSTAELRYLVLPLRPAGTEDWSEDALAALVNRDAMVGVAQVRGG
ncbi:MAG: nitrile hydratase subunit alpha [Alphaproteobacteria bacterium]|nr:nitrile hydratase subunit alpha [Alphaproteobacteria bacterium]